MSEQDPETYAAHGDAAWRWVLDQVRWDDGPWIPTSVPVAGPAGSRTPPTPPSAPLVPPPDRDGMHSGIGGLAHVLAEVRLARPWTEEETALADGIAARLRAGIGGTEEYDYFDGLVSTIGALTALGAAGVGDAVARLEVLATPDGWPQTAVVPPRATPDARINDATLGTAGVLLGALWARRHGAGEDADGAATRLAGHAAEVLLAEAEPEGTGTRWRFVPRRFLVDAAPPTEMPNWSHGLAGVAAALTVAGRELDRADLVDAGRRGAEHLVTLGDRSGGGFVVPVQVPTPVDADRDPVTFSWCHGPTGTSLLFAALEAAGVDRVADESPEQWHGRCWSSVRTSGIPARLHPGFWDNDGRCCGTAGVGDLALDSWRRTGRAEDRDLAVRLADALVERAEFHGPHAWWRFVEHRAEQPLLPPGVGWLQGAAGIAAYLIRAGRVLGAVDGRNAPAVARMDTWWAVPGYSGSGSDGSGPSPANASR
ncbi:hypothetical protein H5V45_17300 [Nocardioides sp. KIGAM211]|uniref:Lanthionine synthetase n=1 Tax=Nocardioides luti TaxID=2761101 RepID=A0A7X0RJ45_9ACTN|nr:lanthionine synthetase LanC family protein [Nocardioides luti]MBB6629087.1 hypothetical protein [Nocardioides luti]